MLLEDFSPNIKMRCEIAAVSFYYFYKMLSSSIFKEQLRWEKCLKDSFNPLFSFFINLKTNTN